MVNNVRLPRLSLIFLLVAACVTAKSRFEDAQRFEAEGRWMDAANAYLDALERDRDFPGARDGASRTGQKAVPWAMKAADNLAASGNPAAAAERFRSIALLHARADRFGVIIRLPADYAERRDAAFAAAVDSILAQAKAGQGDWEHRIAMLDRANAYNPNAAQQAEIVKTRYDLLMQWGDAEYAAGHFHTAHGIAGRAAAVYPEGDARAASALALMEKALRDGTVHLAVPPLWFGPDAAGRVTRGFLPSFNGTLQDEYLGSPPPFIAAVDPAAVRREMRELEIDRELLSPNRAATVGKLVKADYAVAGHIAVFEYADTGRETVHEVPTRDGKRARYTLIEGKRVLTITLRFSVVHVEGRQVVADGEVTVSAERPSTRAYFDGDPRRLILAQGEHVYFDRRGQRDADREMERGLTRDLCERYVAAVYERVLGALR